MMTDLVRASSLATKINSKLTEDWKLKGSVMFSVSVGIAKCDELSLVVYADVEEAPLLEILLGTDEQMEAAVNGTIEAYIKGYTKGITEMTMAYIEQQRLGL